ncbi:tRNA (adenosine(37)-N6)-threonylcarbamoyltransferase complex dimerization subunit type 1 TsaB [Lentilactobacillus sp. SPB1-3]|uniref:tRNA (Adenosine(37)-N6)-threonylcarbamoyltransferase complex dimerization subunit type 1 TsaB n=1 Tax=Lentilactobacillus terminaliae TaxID=3003483 RepID=A0ACD5DH20_9LACO|nr:tRNA (adenosine(37)-N6)-threonylcarbamoyltransferase complex dimerization subunit type 1 TsaB [Lentilactobacillus sp. SPB1-3]MCZ0976924.1 tRNA (adenosine(37)-N6)-threonylcarbamoyltransferase complex dimerization subunit type 1 TsaB [Lentilactobacillus sp. SPB1-3]
MKILAIDTSNKPLTVAVLDNNELLATETITTHQKHAEFLLPVIEDLVNKASLKPVDIDRIVVATGPGSYTGVRMATTVAKTLAMTLNIELVPVSSLLNIALTVGKVDGFINPIFDARNDNMYTGLYKWDGENLAEVLPDRHTNIQEWGKQIAQLNDPVTVVANTDSFDEELTNNDADTSIVDHFKVVPSATLLGRYGANLEAVTDIDAMVPRYLRLTKAEADWRQNHPNEDESNYVEKN